MKIAVIVFGVYGDFDTAVKFWKFKDELDCDFYFSTWKKSYKINNVYDHDFMIDVNSEMVTNFIPNATVSVEDESEFNYKRYGAKEINIGITQEKIIYHWKNGIRMIKESGKQYDMIMIMRPDMVYLFNFPISNLYECNKEKTLYNHTGGISNREKGPYINDTFFIGDFNVVSEFIETFDDKCSEDGNHWDTARHILSLGFTVEHINDIEAHLLRPNIRFYKNQEITLDIVIDSFKKWMGWE